MFVLCLTFVITCFFGCSVENLSTDNARYELKKIEGASYLLIPDKTKETIESNIDIGMIQEAEIQFDSIEEFVNNVKNGKLNDRQLAIANKTFSKDSNGIKVCNFSDIQIPVNPIEFECKKVFWSGELYSYSLESKSNTIAYYHLLNKDSYDYQYDNNYLRFFDNESVSVTKTIDYENNAEYYYSTSKGNMKKVRYTLVNGQTTLVVDETYRLSMEDKTIPTSNEVPYRVTIYGIKSDQYFCIDIFDVVSKPTVEWLTDFSVEAYK